MFSDIIISKVNVKITARERGKIVARREGHNVWVNQGRQYLAEVISPLNSSFAAHYNDSPIRIVKYIGVGIGGDAQLVDIETTYPTLADHYPGQNVYSDEVLTVSYLERPIKVTGTPGKGTAPGVWHSLVTAPPTFSGTPITKVTFTTLLTVTNCNLTGYYAAVPLSEVGLFLSNETTSLTSEEVYNYSDPPAYINTSTRQKLIAYNTFATITKTVSTALEVIWEVQF